MSKNKTLVELACLLHERLEWPKPTEVQETPTSLYFNCGPRRYWVTPDLTVLECADGKIFESNHAKYIEGILRGGKRDDSGALILEQA